MYNFALLDPRNVPAAQAANDAVFAGAPQGVLGIEVTVAALAAKCVLGNIDPQHSGGDASRAAIEEALEVELPPDGATLATVRADLDALGAMAVLAMRADGAALGAAALARVGDIAAADKFARGGWPGVRPLPTTDNPWPAEGAGASDSRPLAAMAAAVADFRVPIEERVAQMRHWLLTGEEPARYRAQVETERTDLVRALEAGEIKISPALDGRVAVVESAHRAAMMVGYASAPVVIAINPVFRVSAGEAHRKLTIAAFEPRWCDIRAALGQLAELEPGWGGSPTIGGSPQGVSSALTTEQVVEVVARHLK